MEKTYKFSDFEERIGTLWEESKAFSPKHGSDNSTEAPAPEKAPFVMVIPPPNVTGVLHMGHALNNNIQDVLARYHRMHGRATLWVPGTDHAGIATQQVMERRLAKEGSSRHALGRETFIERTKELAEENKQTIIKQLKSMGVSCDWERERFTLDEKRSEAVQDIFVRLYEKGLVYRSKYLVNWSVGAGTALSDDEVEYKEVQGNLYWISYPLADEAGEIQVASTRPETMLGDTAIAVHPEDPRYKKHVGKMVHVPLTDRKIPIIADSHVDPDFGTGALKVTPGHAAADYEIAQRHTIDCINILNPDGSLNENVPQNYQGLSVNAARKAVADDLETQGFLKKKEAFTHQVGHCYRTGTVIEPMLSNQWFVRMSEMAGKALEALEKDEIRFYPKHWENTYIHWMKNIRDWCISRQLWWGHRIPVWYDEGTGEVIVSKGDPSQLPEHRGKKLVQDEDVLDTWFSSWLWPFSVFGWPEKTEDFTRFYPTSTLVTAYDIIFFWVARMVMAGLEFTGQVPFRDIFIHGLVRDEKGKKMSKSLGNGVDPLSIIKKYGADALKFTLAFLCKLGGDVLINEESFLLGSRFANKVWNASRYLLSNLEQDVDYSIRKIEFHSEEKWIVYRLFCVQNKVKDAMEQYRIDEAAHEVYEYFWWDFCDWYLEISKIAFYNDDVEEKRRVSAFLVWILEENLKILHPFLPFISEEIYGQLQSFCKRKATVLTGTQTEGSVLDEMSKQQLQGTLGTEQELEENASMFSRFQELVRGIRTLRSEFSLSPKLAIDIHVQVDDESLWKYFASMEKIFKQLVRAKDVEFSLTTAEKKGVGVAGHGFCSTVYIAEHIDVAVELQNIAKKIQKITGKLKAQKGQVESPAFLQKARPDYVEKVKQDVLEAESYLEGLQKVEKELEGLV